MKHTRFSILSLLLLITVVGLAIRVYQLSIGSAELKRKNERLVLQTGEFVVEEFDKVYLRPLDCETPLSWQFLCHTPHDRFCLRVASHRDGKPVDDPASQHVAKFRPPESPFLLTIYFYKGKKGVIEYRATIVHGRVGITTGGSIKSDARLGAMRFEHNPHSLTMEHMIGRGYLHSDLQILPPSTPIKLLRIEDPDGKPPTALEVWLEETPSEE